MPVCAFARVRVRGCAHTVSRGGEGLEMSAKEAS